jgi:hypothetical protein
LHNNEPGRCVAWQQTRRGCSHSGKKVAGKHVAAPDRERWWWRQQRTEMCRQTERGHSKERCGMKINMVPTRINNRCYGLTCAY